MIPKVKDLKLIATHMYICDIYNSKLRSSCERFSNNCNPDFTDQEILTIYLYAMNLEQRLKIKQIHESTQAIIFVPGSHFCHPTKLL